MSYYSECVYKCERCVEWIPYDQFNNIKELGKDELTTIYSAIWKNGPLQYDYNKCEYSRQQNNKVNLKSYNSKYYTYEFLSQVYVAYSTGNVREFGPNIYGISQNPHAESYIIVFPNGYHCDKCEKVNFTDGIYSTIWKDGPLYYDNSKCSYLRKQNKTVNLKYLHNSQNIIDEFLNEIKTYSISKSFCGMSQKLDTKDYILVFLQNETCDKCGRQFTYENTKYCKPCQIDDSGKISTNRISGNKEIDNLIQEMQLNINNHGTVVEWIPYTQFNIIKELGKDKLITI
ncbi:kinase-like domain-containing protein [Rhizophagus irregularis DAOM 181602=DAOM 197198]|nr:kinase-like domain-containing protein [Rhizophagus irregularis DAOM 181602=DAOM 197198]